MKKGAVRVCTILRWDLLIGLVLFVLAYAGSGSFLTHHIKTVGYAYKFSTEFLVPAALLGSGEGLVNATMADVPGLKDFIDERTPSFDAAEWDGETGRIPLGWFHCQHLYLFLTLGAWWRVFGVSWVAFKWLTALFYATSAVLLYALFRLGMGRLVSAVGTALFMMSPVALTILPALRDYAKVPFIFATLFIMLYLVKNTVSRRRVYILALVSGLLIGVGLGFRKDVMVCIPPTVAILALAVQTHEPLRLRGRFVAVMLFLASAFISQAPLMAMPSDGAGGAMASHDIICGFATEREANLGLERASYERVYYFWDAYTHALGNSYGHRVSGIETAIGYNSQESASSNDRFVAANMLMFPRDMIARGYAAILRILGNGLARLPANEYPDDAAIAAVGRVFAPFAAGLEWSKVFCACAALLVVSALSLRKAWAALLLFLYMTGYTCLQFHLRHYFHLTFASLWFLGFLVDQGGRGLWHLAARKRQDDSEAPEGEEKPGAKGRARNMAAFAITAAALVLVPFFVGQVWQKANLRSYIATCSEAPLTPLAVRQAKTEAPVPGAQPQPDEGRILFALEEPIRSPRHTSDGEVYEVQTEYLMAEFAPQAEARKFVIRYASETPFNDFSHPITLLATPNSSEGVTRYFFPAYQSCYASVEGQPNPYSGFDGRWGQSLFEGLEIPEEWAGDFKGLYRVTDLKPFKLLLSIEIPPDMRDFRYYQKFDMYSGLEKQGIS